MARALIEKGFTRVRPLKGGFDAWLDAGLPVEDVPLIAIRMGENRSAEEAMP